MNKLKQSKMVHPLRYLLLLTLSLAMSLAMSLAISLALSQAALAQSPVASIEVTQPRAFGYYLGDKFQRIIELTLNKPYTLDESSLPKPGPLVPWLNIEAPDIISSENEYTRKYLITLTYQIINIDKDALDIGVTDHTISIKNDEETLSLLIQPVRIKTATILTTTGNHLQADQRPQTVPVDRRQALMLAVILLASGLVFYALTFGVPFLRETLPFTRSYRQLNKARNTRWSAEQYSNALKTIHSAFNETAGHVVFSEELDDFLAQHSSFQSRADQIRKFFSHSREYYFSDNETNEAEFPQDKLLDLLKGCSVSERGLA